MANAPPRRIEGKGASVDELVVFRLGASLTSVYTARQAVAAASADGWESGGEPATGDDRFELRAEVA